MVEFNISSEDFSEREHFSEPTAPGEFSGVERVKFGSLWSEIERQATRDQDPKAQALVELKKEIKGELQLLVSEGNKFKNNLEDYQKGLRRTDSFLFAVTIVVVIAFITTLSLALFDLVKEKDLYLRYNDMYEKYSDKYQDSLQILNAQNEKIDELETELQLLRARNQFLK